MLYDCHIVKKFWDEVWQMITRILNVLDTLSYTIVICKSSSLTTKMPLLNNKPFDFLNSAALKTITTYWKDSSSLLDHGSFLPEGVLI